MTLIHLWMSEWIAFHSLIYKYSKDHDIIPWRELKCYVFSPTSQMGRGRKMQWIEIELAIANIKLWKAFPLILSTLSPSSISWFSNFNSIERYKLTFSLSLLFLIRTTLCCSDISKKYLLFFIQQFEITNGTLVLISKRYKRLIVGNIIIIFLTLFSLHKLIQ